MWVLEALYCFSPGILHVTIRQHKPADMVIQDGYIVKSPRFWFFTLTAYERNSVSPECVQIEFNVIQLRLNI